jgi:hypothetical protein
MVAVLLCGSEYLFLRKQDKIKITSIDVKFLHDIMGCTSKDTNFKQN